MGSLPAALHFHVFPGNPTIVKLYTALFMPFTTISISLSLGLSYDFITTMIIPCRHKVAAVSPCEPLGGLLIMALGVFPSEARLTIIPKSF